MKVAILTFGRAVFWGSVAGGGPFMLLTVPIAIIEADWTRPGLTIWVAVMPVAIVTAIVVPAAVLLGLPLTAWLAFVEEEKQSTYVWAGLGLGALLPLAIVLYLGGDSSGAFLSLPGAVAGAVTAAIWGRWRETAACGIGAEAAD